MRLGISFVSLLVAVVCIFVSSASADGKEGGSIYDSKGRRDPFTPLITGSGRGYTGLRDVETLDDIILEGILWDGEGNSIAVLNGEIIKEDDVISNIGILEILPGSVLLEIDGVRHEIKLEKK